MVQAAQSFYSYLFMQPTTGMCWRALNPVNAANGAREEVREEEGVLGVSFPRAGKAGILENTVSLGLWKHSVFFIMCSLLRLQKNLFWAGKSPGVTWLECGSTVGGSNCLWCLMFRKHHRSSWWAHWDLLSWEGVWNRLHCVTLCAKIALCAKIMWLILSRVLIKC